MTPAACRQLSGRSCPHILVCRRPSIVSYEHEPGEDVLNEYRYQGLEQAEGSGRAEDAAAAQPSAGLPCALPCQRHHKPGLNLRQPCMAGSYQAAGFSYDSSAPQQPAAEARQPPQQQQPPPDPFEPWFNVPERLRGSLPGSLRAHKVSRSCSVAKALVLSSRVYGCRSWSKLRASSGRQAARRSSCCSSSR